MLAELTERQIELLGQAIDAKVDYHLEWLHANRGHTNDNDIQDVRRLCGQYQAIKDALGIKEENEEPKESENAQ